MPGLLSGVVLEEGGELLGVQGSLAPGVVGEEGVAALRLRGQLSEARHPRGQLIGTVGVGVALGGGGVMSPRRGVAAVEADVPHGAGRQADRRREAREGRGVHAAEPYSQFA